MRDVALSLHVVPHRQHLVLSYLQVGVDLRGILAHTKYIVGGFVLAGREYRLNGFLLGVRERDLNR